MKASPARTPALVCEIRACEVAQAATFAEIANSLAIDVGQPIEVRIVRLARAARLPRETTLTLHLPAALAATQSQVWCLACRLACFCPNARVSVLVQGEAAFAA